MVWPVRDDRYVVLSLSCGARLRPGIRSTTAHGPGRALPEASMPGIMLGMMLGMVMS